MCEFKDRCNVCAGLIDDPEICARHKLAAKIGIDKVPEWLTTINYEMAAKLAREAV